MQYYEANELFLIFAKMSQVENACEWYIYLCENIYLHSNCKSIEKEQVVLSLCCLYLVGVQERGICPLQRIGIPC